MNTMSMNSISIKLYSKPRLSRLLSLEDVWDIVAKFNDLGIVRLRP